jgi:ketosteroid isomerase-like protein
VAKLNKEQAMAVSEVQQLINDWAYELDVHNGLEIANLVTEDCIYSVRGTSLEGRAAIENFYKGRTDATPHALQSACTVSKCKRGVDHLHARLLYYGRNGVRR